MEAIRTTKIDGQEFVTLTDYLRLKEENKVVGILNDEIRRINKNLREENKRLKEEKEKLNIIIENTKKEQKSDREHIEELEEENQKLKERIAELEKCNINIQEQIDKITADRDERKRKEECSNVIIDFVKQQAREKGWEL